MCPALHQLAVEIALCCCQDCCRDCDAVTALVPGSHPASRPVFGPALAHSVVNPARGGAGRAPAAPRATARGMLRRRRRHCGPGITGCMFGLTGCSGGPDPGLPPTIEAAAGHRWHISISIMPSAQDGRGATHLTSLGCSLPGAHPYFCPAPTRVPRQFPYPAPASRPALRPLRGPSPSMRFPRGLPHAHRLYDGHSLTRHAAGLARALLLAAFSRGRALLLACAVNLVALIVAMHVRSQRRRAPKMWEG